MASSVSAPGEEDEGIDDPLAAVFISTSLNTNLALDVHLNDTIAELKKNIVAAHWTLFPGYKEIKIDAVKLKRQDLSYSLSDSMLVRTILGGVKGNMFLCVDASVCGEEHLEEQGLIHHAQGLNIEEDNEDDAVKGASSLGTKGTDHKETSIEELPLIVPELAVVDNTDQVNGVQQNGRPEQGDNNREFIRDEAIPKAVGAVVCEPLVADVVGDQSYTRKRKKPAPKKKSSRKQDPEENKKVAKHVEGSKVASSSAETKIPNETADPEMRPLKGDPKEKSEPKHLVVIGLKGDSCLDKSEEAVNGDRTEVHSQGALSKKRKGKGPKSTEQVGDASASTQKTKEKNRKSTNASAVPNPSAVPNSDAVKDFSNSLSDSMLVRTTEGNMFLCVDASVCGEEHLEEQGLIHHAQGLNIEEDNEDDAVKGASSLGTKETDHKETSIEELPLIVPELAVVDNTDQVNGVQQNGRLEQGDNNREFIMDEAIPKAVGAVVCEPLVADVVGDQSYTRKRKKPAPKKESSRKQDPEENKQVAKHVEGFKVASSSAETKIPNETADPEMRPLTGDPKEKSEPKHLVVIGLKGDSCLDKSEEAVNGDRTEVHSQGALSKKRKGKGPKSTEQVGVASASTKKTKEKNRKSTNASAVPNPSAVPNSDKEGETQGAADILGKKGDVAGTNKNTEPIPNTVGSSKDMLVSASSKDVAGETVKSGKEIMKSSNRKEGRKEMNKKRRLTSDRHSVAVQNYSKLAKPVELSEPNASRNNITSSPVLISSPSENDEEAMKIQTRSRRRAAATKPREQRVDG